MLGIIAATPTEANLIVGQLQKRDEFLIQKKTFYKGILKNTPAVVCICGIGKTNAAHGTTLLLEKFKPNFVYIVGVAGAYPSSGLNIGDIAIAEREIYGDEGLIARSEGRSQSPQATRRGGKSEVREKDEINFYTMDKINIPLCITDGAKYYNEFPMYLPEKLRGFKKKGNFVTVSTCTGTLKRGKELEKMFNAICENMEGAAVAHICIISGVSAAEIRGISNIIDNRAAGQLNKSDIVLASENVQEFLYKVKPSHHLFV